MNRGCAAGDHVFVFNFLKGYSACRDCGRSEMEVRLAQEQSGRIREFRQRSLEARIVSGVLPIWAPHPDSWEEAFRRVWEKVLEYRRRMENEAPYGDNVSEPQAPPRTSAPCKEGRHGECGGEGVDCSELQLADHDQVHTIVQRWLCDCGCHALQGLSF